MGLAGLPPVDLYAKETAMSTYPRDAEPGVESQLVDLSEVPLAMLRELDGAAMRRSLMHVMEQTRYAQVRRAGSSERID